MLCFQQNSWKVDTPEEYAQFKDGIFSNKLDRIYVLPGAHPNPLEEVILYVDTVYPHPAPQLVFVDEFENFVTIDPWRRYAGAHHEAGKSPLEYLPTDYRQYRISFDNGVSNTAADADALAKLPRRSNIEFSSGGLRDEFTERYAELKQRGYLRNVLRAPKGAVLHQSERDNDGADDDGFLIGPGNGSAADQSGKSNQSDKKKRNGNGFGENRFDGDQSNVAQSNEGRFNGDGVRSDRGQLHTSTLSGNQLSPGQLGAGQLAGDQFNADQFNEDQFDDDQFNAGQFDDDQFNAGQFGADQRPLKQLGAGPLGSGRLDADQFDEDQFDDDDLDDLVFE